MYVGLPRRLPDCTQHSVALTEWECDVPSDGVQHQKILTI